MRQPFIAAQNLKLLAAAVRRAYRNADANCT